MHNFLCFLSSRSRYRSGIFFADPAPVFFGAAPAPAPVFFSQPACLDEFLETIL